MEIAYFNSHKYLQETQSFSFFFKYAIGFCVMGNHLLALFFSLSLELLWTFVCLEHVHAKITYTMSIIFARSIIPSYFWALGFPLYFFLLYSWILSMNLFFLSMQLSCFKNTKNKKEKFNVILFPFLSKSFFFLYTFCHYYFCCSFFILSYSYPQENQDLYLLCMFFYNAKNTISKKRSASAYTMCTLYVAHDDALCLQYIDIYANFNSHNDVILHVCLCFKSMKICTTFSRFVAIQRCEKENGLFQLLFLQSTFSFFHTHIHFSNKNTNI